MQIVKKSQPLSGNVTERKYLSSSGLVTSQKSRLVVTLKQGESFSVGGIEVFISKEEGNRIRLSIEAPKDELIRVNRI